MSFSQKTTSVHPLKRLNKGVYEKWRRDGRPGDGAFDASFFCMLVETANRCYVRTLSSNLMKQFVQLIVHEVKDARSEFPSRAVAERRWGHGQHEHQQRKKR